MAKVFRALARLFYRAGEALERMADRWPETRERLEDAAIDLSLDLEDMARDAARASRKAASVAGAFILYLVRVCRHIALQGVTEGHRAYKRFRALLPALAYHLRRMPGAWRSAWSWRADLLATA